MDVDNLSHKGIGFCDMRSIVKHKDYCNEETVKGGTKCVSHTCVIQRCKEPAECWYPMMGNVGFCSKHNVYKYTSKYGCDPR